MPKRCPKGKYWNPSRGHCDDEFRRASLGKFEGGLHIDQYLYSIVGEGFADESAGDIQYGRAYDLLRGELLESVENKAMEEGDKLTPAERKMLKDSKGAILSYSDTGFVDVEYYEDEKKLEKDWAEIEKETEHDYDDQNW